MNSKIFLPGRQQNDIAQRCRTYNQHHSAEQPIQQDTHCNPFVLVDLGNGQVCSCRIRFFELGLTMLGQQHNFCNPFVLVDLGNGQICSLNKMPPRAYLDVYPMGRLHNFGRTSPPFPKIGLWRTGYMTIPHWHPHC